MKINQVLIEADPPVDLGAGMARAWQRAWMKQNPGSNRAQALYAAQQMAVSNPDALTKKFDANTAVTVDQMMAATEFDNPADYKGPIGNVTAGGTDDTAGRKDTDGGGDLLATAPNQGGTSADDAALAKMKANAGLDVLGSNRGLSQATGAAMGDVEGGVTTALAKQKSDAGAADKTAAANVDDFSGMAGAETAAKDRAAAANVDDFSGMTKAQMKASTRNAKAQAAKSGINYAGGDPDVDATATAAAPTKQVAAGTGADGPAGRYATKKVAAGTGADGPANRYAKPKATARAADPNALKNKAAFMDKTPPREGGILKKAGSNIGKAITSVTKQTGGREGSSFGDGSNPKVGNLLAKGTPQKTDADLGIASSPDRGDFNPAANLAKPKVDTAKQDRAAANRKAQADKEKREMNANR